MDKMKPHVQRSAKRYANLAKQDPGRGMQNRKARAGTNFSQPNTSLLADLCMRAAIFTTSTAMAPLPLHGYVARCCTATSPMWLLGPPRRPSRVQPITNNTSHKHTRRAAACTCLGTLLI